MATLRAVLDDVTRREFETPPIFDASRRKAFFTLPLWASETLKSLVLANNQVMFALQVGYFRASGRFFDPKNFLNKDIESVCRRLKVKREEISTKNYSKGTRFRHQELILKGFAILPFTGVVEELCIQEVSHLVKRQIKLHLVFGSIVNFIRERYFEVPNYSVLANMINQARDQYENQIQQQLEQHLTEVHILSLVNLFDQYLPDNEQPIHRNTPIRCKMLFWGYFIHKRKNYEFWLMDYEKMQRLISSN